jgi:predicted O-linked N-acetylglucosamine transferase (SPINDLY family)
MLAEPMSTSPSLPSDPSRALALFAEAGRHHEAGRLDEAKRGYLEALEANPWLPEAEHGLAWLLVQQGDWKGALPRFGRALKLRPWEREFWISQLEALFQVGQYEAVHRLLHRALDAGMPAELARQFESRLAQRRRERLAAAVQASGKDAARAAKAPQAEMMALREAFLAKRYREAERLAAAMVRRYPLCAFGWRVLAACQSPSAGGDEAMEVLRIACDLDPGNVDVRMNLGLALFELGRLDEAETLLREVLRTQPTNVRALVNLGLLLSARRDPAAEAMLVEARRLGSRDPRVALALGSYLRDHGRSHEALPLLREGIAADSESELGLTALAAALQDVGEHAEAIEVFGRLRRLRPKNLTALSMALFVGSHMEGIPPEELFALHRHYGEAIEAAVAPDTHHGNDPDPERRLRVGFVSGDLFGHAVAYFIRPLWRAIDHGQLEVFAYYAGRTVDETTASLKGLVDHWRDVADWDDELLAATIRRDRIDVLIDMSGHTSANRLSLFARQPAPLQISWLGYPATTGLSRMQYYLADTAYVSTGALDAQFTEKLLLSEVGCGFEPDANLPPVAPLPNLGGEAFTFGSFNRVAKLTPATLSLWAAVMQRLPAARLLIGATDADDQLKLRAALGRLGIEAERLRFLPRLDRRAYLEAHAQVDLLLDAYPYGGGTTTCHGLWMGVPTLTLAGPTLASRSGLSVVGRAGLHEFVATDREGFVDLAARWAGDPEGLSRVRAGLRARLAEGGLGNPALVARAFEAAMRQVWRRWCEGLPPVRMVVPRPENASVSRTGVPS